jgi:hypothetical protein
LGGWRSDSVVLDVSAPAPDAEIVEPWSAIGPRWTAFGTPRPYVSRIGGRPVLAPNGDSTHISGVLSNWRLSTKLGMGMEFDLSMPLTADQWQMLAIGFVRADRRERAGWDLELGDFPHYRYEWAVCGISYPTLAEGEFGSHIELRAGIMRKVRIPRSVVKGDWVRLRIQYLPDGRCALAINGRAAAIVDRPMRLGDSSSVHIGGYSHRTRFLVGEFRAWTGVKPGVNWSVLVPAAAPGH